ncbi:cyclic lactone autoinducer peptide [Paenibacillus sp. sgz500958]
MKKAMAKHASSALAASARFFASVMKLVLHSPEIPEELHK